MTDCIDIEGTSAVENLPVMSPLLATSAVTKVVDCDLLRQDVTPQMQKQSWKQEILQVEPDSTTGLLPSPIHDRNYMTNNLNENFRSEKCVTENSVQEMSNGENYEESSVIYVEDSDEEQIAIHEKATAADSTIALDVSESKSNKNAVETQTPSVRLQTKQETVTKKNQKTAKTSYSLLGTCSCNNGNVLETRPEERSTENKTETESKDKITNRIRVNMYDSKNKIRITSEEMVKILKPRVVVPNIGKRLMQDDIYCVQCSRLFFLRKDFNLHRRHLHGDTHFEEQGFSQVKVFPKKIRVTSSHGDYVSCEFRYKPNSNSYQTTHHNVNDSENNTIDLVDTEIKSTDAINNGEIEVKYEDNINNVEISMDLGETYVNIQKDPNGNANKMRFVPIEAEVPRDNLNEEAHESEINRPHIDKRKTTTAGEKPDTHSDNSSLNSLNTDTKKTAQLNTMEISIVCLDDALPKTYTNIKKLNNTPKPNSTLCIHCNGNFQTKENLISHMYDVLTKKYLCQQCAKIFDTEKSLLQHLDSCHREVCSVASNQLDKPIMTKSSQKSSTNNDKRIRRIPVKEGHFPYKPPKNSKHLIESAALKTASYLCYKCSKTFDSEKILLKHLSICHREVCSNATNELYMPIRTKRSNGLRTNNYSEKRFFPVKKGHFTYERPKNFKQVIESATLTTVPHQNNVTSDKLIASEVTHEATNLDSTPKLKKYTNRKRILVECLHNSTDLPAETVPSEKASLSLAKTKQTDVNKEGTASKNDVPCKKTAQPVDNIWDDRINIDEGIVDLTEARRRCQIATPWHDVVSDTYEFMETETANHDADAKNNHATIIKLENNISTKICQLIDNLPSDMIDISANEEFKISVILDSDDDEF